MKRSIRLLILPAIMLGAPSAHALDRPNYNAYFDDDAAPSLTPPARLNVADPSGFAAALDARRGIPTFLRAGDRKPLPPVGHAASAEGAARFYIRSYAHRWNVPSSIVANLELAHIHNTGRGGIIATFRQRIQDVEVFHGEIKVLMARNFELVAISGSPRADAPAELKRKGGTFKLDSKQAIIKGINDLYATSLKPADLTATREPVADYRYFDLAHTQAVQAAKIRLTEPFRIKKVFFQLPNRLVAGYFLEIIAARSGSAASDFYAYVIAADDGRVLYRQNLTAYESFNYRVFADPDGRPTDGPIVDLTPHPTGTPDPTTPVPFISPELIAMEGFNHNSFNQSDPWLPFGATQTLGNNVDCYTDDNTPDGYSNGDLRATITASNTFDRVFDLNAEPQSSTGQMMAAVTHLFYLNNWHHDRFYDSGFDEAAGNAQENNFGRGGLGGDVLRAEAQDSALLGSRNNANMSTPADGTSPRMQMYLYTGINQQALTLKPNKSLETNTAGLGPKNFDVTAAAVVADDGSTEVVTGPAPLASVNDGCQPLINDVVGKIAIIDRGNCPFVLKVQNAQEAGAVGAVIANHSTQATAIAPPLGGTPAVPITIASLSTTYDGGNDIKAAIAADPNTEITLFKHSGIERDGTIDSTVIAHEWGHYLHHRLETCGLNQCRGMSEGWGDFTALQMVVRPGDNLDGTYAQGIYVGVSYTPAPAYFGDRRAPYTTDMTKNAFTYKHIVDGEPLPMQPFGFGGANNAEVHNIGEIWANTMFEGYIALLKESKGANPRYTFEEARRLMNDYVVAGMKITPDEASFTEQRDAILAAAYANEPLDTTLLANAFAKRGLGTCAVSPPKDTESMEGAVESFSNQGNFAVVSVEMDDSVESCDDDGVVDAEETGRITVTVMNNGLTTLSGTTVSVATTNAEVMFSNGGTITLPSIEAYSTAKAEFDVRIDPALKPIDLLDLTTTVENPAGCLPSIAGNRKIRINYDSVASVASTDDVESDILGWTRFGAGASEIWSREAAPTGNHTWHGIDYSTNSDTALESPSLTVSTTEPLVISFDHRYSFEWEPTTNWDGGVIEISSNNGQKWQDISAFVDPGYGGVLTNESGNPLADRNAFVGDSAAYPAMEPFTLDLGTQLAGKTIKIRFRIGTDAGAGAFGWELDNLVFQGIANTPFPSIIEDGTVCPHAPVADAGPDQNVKSGTMVALDGSASSDPDNDSLSYVWKQMSGMPVGLINPDSAKPTFLAPIVSADTTLTFQLKVSDGQASDQDLVDIVVQPPPMGSGGAGGTGGEGGMGGAGGSGEGGAGEGGAGGGGGATTSSSSGSASSSSSSSTGTGSGIEPPTASGNGCDCTTTGSSSNNEGAIGAGLLGAAVLFLRRRHLSRRAGRSS